MTGGGGRRTRYVYHRPVAFWLGVVAVTTGVVLHLPMYTSASNMNYRMAGMSVDAAMVIGMVLIVLGILATGYGLWPRNAPDSRAADVSVRPLDGVSLGRAHILLILVLSLAVTIDVMKPITLAFVAPGFSQEYDLKSALNPGGGTSVAWLPLFGIIGTVLGSFIWGGLGDRLGRRALILFAAVLFIGTSICGTMPDYRLNLLMCFLMGLSVGGMLPITFALVSETMPARHRGWLMVLIGGDVAGAYFLTSWLSSILTPEYGWRVLWLLGLPTGVLLLLLNRWIPESPRFLLANGRAAEATAVLRRYGARIVVGQRSELAVEDDIDNRWRALLSRAFRSSTAVVCMFGLGIGLVAFGFQLWIPLNLQALGFDGATADTILRDGALIGLPATFVVAFMYGFWSTKKTTIILALVTALALAGFIVVGDDIVDHRALLYILLAIPITASSSMLAVLIAYSAEIYPTKLRSRGTGLAAGASKVGGVLIIALVVAEVAPPSIQSTALIGAIPLIAAALLVTAFGRETRNVALEEITDAELADRELVGVAPT